MKSVSILLTLCLAGVITACSTFASPTETPVPTETPTDVPSPTMTFTPAATQTPIVIIVTATPDAAAQATSEPTAAPQSSRNDSSFATRTNCTPNSSWTTRYTVRAGNTVGQIAQATGSTVAAIAEGNCLSNANNIFVGQRLRVPRTPVFEVATEEVTEEPTEEVTEEATEEATEEVTEEPTEEVTEEVTEEATEEVTEEATEEATEEVTEEP